MIYGCCTSIGRYVDLVLAGYDSITLPGIFFGRADERTFAKAAETIRNGPLQFRGLNAFSPPDVKMTGPNYDRAALRAYAETVIGRAGRLGARYIGIGCPHSRNVPDGFSRDEANRQFREVLADLCEIARPYGIDILLEGVCAVEGNFITTAREALALIRDLALPNLHLCYDIYHEFMMGEGPDVILDAGAEIRTVHIAEDVGGKRHYLDEAQTGKYRPYIEALRQIGYAGELTPEAFFGDVEIEFPRSLSIMKAL